MTSYKNQIQHALVSTAGDPSEEVVSVQIVDANGDQITSFGGGTQYTEGDTDSTITGSAILWEDTSDTLRSVSAAKPLPVRVGDGTNQVTLLTAGSDAESNTSNRLPITAWLKSFNGTTWDRLCSGLTGAQSAVTGFLNTLGMGQYNSTAPTLTNAQACNLQLDSAANLKVNIGTALPPGTNAIGKLAQNDNVDIGDVSINNIPASPLPVRVGDGTNQVTLLTAGSDAESNTSNRLPITAWLQSFNGTTWDRLCSGLTDAQSAVTGFLNTLGMGQYNSTAPTLTNAQACNLQLDSAANLKVNIGTALPPGTNAI